VVPSSPPPRPRFRLFEYDHFLAFSDALRADPALRDRYNALERAWDGRDTEGYRAAKGAFVRSVIGPR
jgi:GrpB-like predicted nucleotidyltransferase (UPF0157 family)